MKISLITVCYNSESTIEDTLKSVLNQTYKNYEYLIIDGKSKDNTLDIIKKYEPKFEGKMKIVSEKDNGLFDAMNKGIKLSNGDIIGLLNSDDVLFDEKVFEQIINVFKNNDVDGTYSDLIFVDENLKNPTRNFIAHYPKKNGWHPPHPTLYLKKEVYDKIGFFDTKYKIAADYDFMLRMINNNTKLFYIKKYLIKMRTGGASTNGIKGYISNLKESNQVLKNNNIKFSSFCNFIRILKTVGQSLSAKLNKNELKKIL